MNVKRYLTKGYTPRSLLIARVLLSLGIPETEGNKSRALQYIETAIKRGEIMQTGEVYHLPFKN